MVKGAGTTLAQRTEVWAFPGMDGVGAQKIGKHDGAFRFEAVLYDTSDLVDAWFAALEALQSNIGPIVDDWGVTHASCLITRVGERRKSAAQLPGSTLAAIGRMEIVGHKTA
jgi:hypothetical protein